MSTLTLYRDPFAASFDDVVRGFFGRQAQRQQPGQQPAARAIRFDVAEQGNTYVVSAELPGYKKEDVQVEIDGARVTITAEAKAQKETADGEKVVYSERYTGKAVRSFELTSEIDNDTASAKYENGILTLTLPKKTAETRKLLNIA
ncbi:MAG TPA: Hsp20/alpha crystallin family protein [Burkholderiales bacterium]|jgi:HSP20 family protein|nr:Hsp20/alpha crystallin family protein [Burkholderiales bacterium]